jgi:hypothetical protein
MTRAFTGRLARGIRNQFLDDHSHHAPAAYPEVHCLTSPVRAAGRKSGNPDVLNDGLRVSASLMTWLALRFSWPREPGGTSPAQSSRSTAVCPRSTASRGRLAALAGRG